MTVGILADLCTLKLKHRYTQLSNNVSFNVSD